MNQPRLLLSTLALLAGAALAADSNPPPSQDRIDQLEQTVLEQDRRLVETELELQLLHAQTAVLSDACQKLGGALQSSRANGFEAAGANPQAKTDLLEGLMTFSDSVHAATRTEPEAETPADG